MPNRSWMIIKHRQDGRRNRVEAGLALQAVYPTKSPVSVVEVAKA